MRIYNLKTLKDWMLYWHNAFEVSDTVEFTLFNFFKLSA